MHALIRFVLLLFVLSAGELGDGVLLADTRLMEDRAEKRSVRREVMSRIVEGDMKFWVRRMGVSGEMKDWEYKREMNG